MDGGYTKNIKHFKFECPCKWNLIRICHSGKARYIGASKTFHLEDVVVAAFSVLLAPEEVVYLEDPYIPRTIVGYH